MPALRRQTIDLSAVAPRLELATERAEPQEILRLVSEKLASGRAAHLRFLKSRLRSHEDAEDVLQDFSLKALQGSARLSGTAKIDAWLNVALRNALFDRYRRNAGRARLQDAVRVEPVAVPDGDSDLELPMACLDAAMQGMKPDAAALLQAAELQETPLKRIAGDLGITANNVGVRVHRAREALRKSMQARCGACAEPCSLALVTRRTA